MGTASTTKFLRNNVGTVTEQPALITSAGSADAQRIPALNASGVLDPSIVNSAAASTGAASAGKLAALNGAGVLDPTIVNSTITSAGAGSSGKLVALDGSGRIDASAMPVGVTPEVAYISTSEAISAGDFVNVWNSAGAKVRKADATMAGKEAHGFVLSGFASGVAAAVYFEGVNTSVTGQTPGPVFLSTTAGTAAVAPPSGAGNVIQRVGTAISATSINFFPQDIIVLA